MNSEDVIREIRQNASEWLEMTSDPKAMIIEIMAKKIINLNEYIEYLERRLNNANVR